MRRRRVGFLLIFGALVPLAVAATAWACGVLATLKVNTPVANPGQTLSVTGVNYSDNMSQFTPVQVRWNSRTGPVLGQDVPSSTRIETTVEVPADARPGWYVLNATQNNIANGTPKSGTPGRTTVRVQGAASGEAAPWSKAPGGGTPVSLDGNPGGPALLPTLLGVVLSLGLLGTGLTLVSRSRTRRANRPLLGV